MINLTKNAVYVINRMLIGKEGYGLRLKHEDGCCGVKFNLFFDKKAVGDKIIKSHEDLEIFADRDTLAVANFLKKKKQFGKTTVDYIRSPLTKGFIADNQRININIWEHEIEYSSPR